jgi:hypothetical protein
MKQRSNSEHPDVYLKSFLTLTILSYFFYTQGYLSFLNFFFFSKVEEFSEKQKDVESVCNPIITKLYQGAGGMPGGEFPFIS